MDDYPISRLQIKSVLISTDCLSLKYQEGPCNHFKYNGQALHDKQANQYILDDGPNVIGNQ
jgi:hypothetical protein